MPFGVAQSDHIQRLYFGRMLKKWMNGKVEGQIKSYKNRLYTNDAIVCSSEFGLQIKKAIFSASINSVLP